MLLAAADIIGLRTLYIAGAVGYSTVHSYIFDQLTCMLQLSTSIRPTHQTIVGPIHRRTGKKEGRVESTKSLQGTSIFTWRTFRRFETMHSGCAV